MKHLINSRRAEVQERANKEQKDYVLFDIPEDNRFELFCKKEFFTKQAYHTNVQVFKPKND